MAPKLHYTPEQIDKLAEQAPCIAEMFRRGMSAAAVDRALGFSGAAAQWARGANRVAKSSETAARNWLMANAIPGGSAPEGPRPPALKVVEPPKPAAPKPTQALAPEGQLALVVVPTGRVSAFTRLCAAMGATVETME